VTTLYSAELHDLEQETFICTYRQRLILISVIQIAAVISAIFCEHNTRFSLCHHQR